MPCLRRINFSRLFCNFFKIVFKNYLILSVNFAKLIFFSIIFSLISSACSDKFINGSITKRRYTKGYYFSSNKKKNFNLNLRTNSKIVSDKENVTLETQNKNLSINLKTSTIIDSVELIKNSGVENLVLNEITKEQSTSFFSSKKSIARDISFAINPKRSAFIGLANNEDWNATMDAVQFFFMALLFLLFTVIYTVGILSSSPGFPIVFAVPLAMVMALISVVTGIYFY